MPKAARLPRGVEGWWTAWPADPLDAYVLGHYQLVETVGGVFQVRVRRTSGAVRD